MFDETFIHWAENRTDVDRLILFCDVERPLHHRLVARFNHWMESTVRARDARRRTCRATRWALLNRVFGWAYYAALARARR